MIDINQTHRMKLFKITYIYKRNKFLKHIPVSKNKSWFLNPDCKAEFSGDWMGSSVMVVIIPNLLETKKASKCGCSKLLIILYVCFGSAPVRNVTISLKIFAELHNIVIQFTDHTSVKVNHKDKTGTINLINVYN